MPDALRQQRPDAPGGGANANAADAISPMTREKLFADAAALEAEGAAFDTNCAEAQAEASAKEEAKETAIKLGRFDEADRLEGEVKQAKRRAHQSEYLAGQRRQRARDYRAQVEAIDKTLHDQARAAAVAACETREAKVASAFVEYVTAITEREAGIRALEDTFGVDGMKAGSRLRDARHATFNTLTRQHPNFRHLLK